MGPLLHLLWTQTAGSPALLVVGGSWPAWLSHRSLRLLPEVDSGLSSCTVEAWWLLDIGVIATCGELHARGLGEEGLAVGRTWLRTVGFLFSPCPDLV